jgi:hypothetical protein
MIKNIQDFSQDFQNRLSLLSEFSQQNLGISLEAQGVLDGRKQ